MNTDYIPDERIHRIALIISLSIATLSFLALVTLLAVTMKRLEAPPAEHRSIRHRRKILCVLATLAGLSGSAPFTFGSDIQSFWSSLAWALAGSCLVAIFALCFGALLARAVTGRIESAQNDDDDRPITSGINPGTGYPMLDGSVDVGGFPYGCSPRSSDDDFGMGHD
jgi:hypothetical protein